MLTRLLEKILLKFSRKTEEMSSHDINLEEWSVDTALSLLQRVYTNFTEQVHDKKVCDFGCGVGYQSVALAHAAKAGKVLGVDINPRRLKEAKKFSEEFLGGQHARNIEFSDGIDVQHKGEYDFVISQNSMEHFPHPTGTLNQMKLLLNPHGQIFITFGPPWYAPYGAHMQFFTNLPWVHLLFPEKVVMNVRTRYRSDGAQKYEEVESGLNRMSVAKFERIIKQSGMKIVFKNYQCIKGLNFLGKIPLLRELFINHVSVALAPAKPYQSRLSRRLRQRSVHTAMSARGRLVWFKKQFQIAFSELLIPSRKSSFIP
jgi:SAM-dependent methyltransferase